MDDGVGIEYAEAGEGFPLVWCHEFSGSMESWLQQVHFFSRRYRVITYNARGYPPSDVPTDINAYTIERAVADLVGLLRHLGIPQAFAGGLSMGGGTALQFGIRHPEMARGLIVASAGSGSVDPVAGRAMYNQNADELERLGPDWFRQVLERPTRTQLRDKDPVGWQTFAELSLGHSVLGSAMTMRGIQARRPTIFELEPKLRELRVPTLILAGDEDEPCIEPAIFMKRTIPSAGLLFFPQSGHTINLEEPGLFNQVVFDFLTAVEAGKWRTRAE
jgi:pimeloyl-ACP methyl ester carboxylesterase